MGRRNTAREVCIVDDDEDMNTKKVHIRYQFVTILVMAQVTRVTKVA